MNVNSIKVREQLEQENASLRVENATLRAKLELETTSEEAKQVFQAQISANSGLLTANTNLLIKLIEPKPTSGSCLFIDTL